MEGSKAVKKTNLIKTPKELRLVSVSEWIRENLR